MKSMLDRRDVRAPCEHAGDLERVLVGLGAAVDEEHARQIKSREAYQPLGRAAAHLQWYRIALKAQGARLSGEGRGPQWMAIAESGDRVSSVEIEHTAAIASQQPHAFARNDRQRILRKHGSERVA